MKSVNSRLANTANGLIIILIVGYLFYIGKAIIVPILFAVIFSFLLYPVCRWLERKGFSRIAAIITSMLVLFLLFSGTMTLFSAQFANLFNEMDRFRAKIQHTFAQLLEMLKSIDWLEENMQQLLSEAQARLISVSQNMVSRTLISSTLFLGYTIMVIVYIFLFLLYRTAFKEFVISQFRPERREQALHVIYNSQRLIQRYFFGLLIVIMILGTMTSVGLYFIGIEHAFLFGFFAALLNVIPYVGTTIGGTLPFLYAWLNYDELWKPLAVFILYQVVQTLEGNYITPKIVGSKVSINPLIAVLVLLVGGLYWGIPGMILAIPSTAIIKLIFDNTEEMKPYGMLLGSEFKHSSTWKKNRLFWLQEWLLKRKKDNEQNGNDTDIRI